MSEVRILAASGAGSVNPFKPVDSQKALKYSFEKIKDKDRKIMTVHTPLIVRNWMS